MALENEYKNTKAALEYDLGDFVVAMLFGGRWSAPTSTGGCVDAQTVHSMHHGPWWWHWLTRWETVQGACVSLLYLFSASLVVKNRQKIYTRSVIALPGKEKQGIGAGRLWHHVLKTWKGLSSCWSQICWHHGGSLSPAGERGKKESFWDSVV